MSTGPASRPTLVQYKNCRLLRDRRLLWEDLWVRDGRIQDPRKLFWEEKVTSDAQVDCGGCIISPGFIDTQINGGFGVDFSSVSEDIAASIGLVSRRILAHGVTAFCPTIITSSHETYRKISLEFPMLRNQDHDARATVLGLHLEGPFINAEKRGAHPAGLVRSFAENGFQDVLASYTSLDDVAIVTLAPEVPRSDQVIGELTKRGIKVSLGHSMASLEESEAAVESGATFITHLFNAMLPFHHRDPGLVGLLASSRLHPGRTVYYGIIADGVHTNPAALRIACETHPDGAVLVTDAVAAMGLDRGSYTLGSVQIEVGDAGRAFVSGTSTLVGSVATMDACVRFFKASARCSTERALEAATLHPARMLGVERDRGTLDYGSVADFVALDDDLNVASTYLAGRRVYGKLPGLQDACRGQQTQKSRVKRTTNGSFKGGVVFSV